MTLNGFTRELINRGFTPDDRLMPKSMIYCAMVDKTQLRVTVSVVNENGLLSPSIELKVFNGSETKFAEDRYGYSHILRSIDETIKKLTPVITTLTYSEVNIDRDKLPKKLRLCFCEKPENLIDAWTEWKKLTNNPKLRGELGLSDYIFASILFGGNWTNCVAKSVNTSKRRHMDKVLSKMREMGRYNENEKPMLFQRVKGLRFDRVHMVFYNGPWTLDEIQRMWTYDRAPTTECFLAWDKQDNN